MVSSPDFQKSVAIGRDAMTNMVQNRIPAYPKAYEVWYTHLADKNPKLSAAIQQMVEKFGRVSPSQMIHLYENFIAQKSEDERMESIGSQITKEASILEGVVHRAHHSTEQFGTILKQAASDLGLDLDPQKLQVLIQRLSLETDHTQSRNQEILVQLKNAHEAIERLKLDLMEIREENRTDQLTMVGNRRHFDRILRKAVQDHSKSGKPLCLLMTDIDFFKKFNDKWGHQTGDQVLKLVASALKRHARDNDVTCRYGGEEFAIIMPETNLSEAMLAAERVRTTVAKREIIKRSNNENLGRITISVGLAQLRIGEQPEHLIERADRCLYAAKNMGRNRITTERELEADTIGQDYSGKVAGVMATDSPQPQAEV